jgi:hypothetical protein
MLPIIVSYYTKNSLYEKQVEDLVRSCEELQLEYDITGIASLGSWSANCCFKPTFLLQKLLQYRRPIVWTDADSVMMKRPELLGTLRCDLAVHVRELLPVSDRGKVLSGTVFINYSSLAKRLLKMWILECQRQGIDQEALRDVLFHYPHGASVEHLPASYCHIFDKGDNPDAVFVHYQASRMEKDHEVVKLFLQELSGEEFKTFHKSINETYDT